MTKGLATDPGKLPTHVMLRRFIAMDARMAARRAAIALGLIRLRNILPDAWAVPDTTLARRALEHITLLNSPVVLNHALRTYAFGAVLGDRSALKFDKELFFLGAVLHDIGLSDIYADDPGSFEWAGSKRAATFCSENGLSAERTDILHDAVALHSSVGIAHKREPEIALVHYGAGLDLMGMRLGEIPPTALEAILERYPRTDFKCGFGEVVRDQARRKPKSHIAGHVAVGLPERIWETLR